MTVATPDQPREHQRGRKSFLLRTAEDIKNIWKIPRFTFKSRLMRKLSKVPFEGICVAVGGLFRLGQILYEAQ